MVDRPNDEEQRPAEAPKDFVADIRQEITRAETEPPAPRQGLLKRVTGLLRRKKGSQPLETTRPEESLVLPTIEPVLFTPEEDDELFAPEARLAQAQPPAQAAQPEPEPPPAGPALVDFDDDFLAGQLDVVSDDAPLPPVAPAAPPPAALLDEELPADDLRAQLMAEDAIPDTPGLYTAPAGQPPAGEADEEVPDALRALMMAGEEEPTAPQAVPDAPQPAAAPDELPRPALFDDDLMRPERGPDLFAPAPAADEPASPAAALFDDDLMRPETGPDLFAPEPAEGEADEPAAPLFDDDLMRPETGPADPGPDAPEPPAAGAPPQPPPPRTRGLRGLLTGILRPGEEKRRQQAERDAIDDQVVTSRLSRSLGQEVGLTPEGEPLLESGHEPMTLTPGMPGPDDDEPHWDRLILAAGPVALHRAAERTPEAPAEDETAPVGEDQTQPAESAPPAPQPPSPADLVDNERLFWDGAVPAAGLPDGEDTIADRLSSMDDAHDHAHERAFWEGTGVAQVKPLTSAPLVPMDEMRSMVLEEYDERGAQIEVESDTHIDLEVEKRHGVRRRAALSRLERVLVAVLVVLALALAGALSLLFIQPPPQVAAIISRPTGAPLSGAMLPTGIELPGGWYFGLERNTLVDGKWQPQAAEWLEGSELPRVVAIPWNRQTEAVIQSFETNDRVRMFFGNNTNIDYKVREVKRVDVNDVSIFQERRPSLVVVLYQENALQRWVIVCGR